MRRIGSFLLGHLSHSVSVQSDQSCEVFALVTDNDDVADQRMSAEEVFDVRRRDSLTGSGDNHILLTSSDEQTTIVEFTLISSSQPAVLEASLSAFRVVNVTLEYVVSSKQNLVI